MADEIDPAYSPPEPSGPTPRLFRRPVQTIKHSTSTPVRIETAVSRSLGLNFISFISDCALHNIVADDADWAGNMTASFIDRSSGM